MVTPVLQTFSKLVRLIFWPAIIIIAISFHSASASDFTVYPLKCGIYKMGGIIKQVKHEFFVGHNLLLAEKSYSQTSVRLKFTKELPYKEAWAVLKVRVDKIIGPYIVEASIIDTPKILPKNLSPGFESYAVLEKEEVCAR